MVLSDVDRLLLLCPPINIFRCNGKPLCETHDHVEYLRKCTARWCAKYPQIPVNRRSLLACARHSYASWFKTPSTAPHVVHQYLFLDALDYILRCVRYYQRSHGIPSHIFPVHSPHPSEYVPDIRQWSDVMVAYMHFIAPIESACHLFQRTIESSARWFVPNCLPDASLRAPTVQPGTADDSSGANTPKTAARSHPFREFVKSAWKNRPQELHAVACQEGPEHVLKYLSAEWKSRDSEDPSIGTTAASVD